MEQPFRMVGRRLAATREALGITQAELCRQLRVDPAALESIRAWQAAYHH